MAAPSPTTSTLPTRAGTDMSEGAIPDEDSSETTRLFIERLQAWKHAVGYLEEYVEATAKMQKAHAKENEKVLKTVSNPLREAHHFDQSVGGIAGVFDNIRTNTQGIANTNLECEKTLVGSVLPAFNRLHAEIKSKTKEVEKGAGKGSKAVDKARGSTQKHIELLGTHAATFDAASGSMKAGDDPYVLQRGIRHRLNKQVIEENNNKNDLLAVQNNFAQFEAHVIQTIQQGMGQFQQVMIQQGEAERQLYSDMAATSQRVPHDFEWTRFVGRNQDLLVDANAPPRTVDSIRFPNQNHRATQPLIAGSLEKKGKILKKYDTGYFVVTPSKFLHEYKTDDDFAKEPLPENSLYLPDCTVGALDGQKFNVKGKDMSKSKAMQKMAMTHEYAFRAHTPQDAAKWYEVIRSVAGQTTTEMPVSEPNSPTSPQDRVQTQGSLNSELASPTSANTMGTHTTGTTMSPTAPTGTAVPQTTGTVHSPTAPTGTAVPFNPTAQKEGPLP